MIGAAITPLMTALQYSARIGSIGTKLMIVPIAVAAARWRHERPCPFTSAIDASGKSFGACMWQHFVEIMARNQFVGTGNGA
jgi:hypothetical protein